MTGFLEAAAVALIPACGVMGIVCLAAVIDYVWDLLCGDAELPKRKKRKSRKIPRKAATSRGIVGQRVSRSAYTYTTMVPQPTLDVKGNLPLVVEWRWYSK